MDAVLARCVKDAVFARGVFVEAGEKMVLLKIVCDEGYSEYVKGVLDAVIAGAVEEVAHAEAVV